jgi:hypothetical protein
MSLVHKKSMKVYDVSSGNACNVLNVDPEMVSYLAADIHDFWSLPLSTLGNCSTYNPLTCYSGSWTAKFLARVVLAYFYGRCVIVFSPRLLDFR